MSSSLLVRVFPSPPGPLPKRPTGAAAVISSVAWVQVLLQRGAPRCGPERAGSRGPRRRQDNRRDGLPAREPPRPGRRRQAPPRRSGRAPQSTPRRRAPGDRVRADELASFRDRACPSQCSLLRPEHMARSGERRAQLPPGVVERLVERAAGGAEALGEHVERHLVQRQRREDLALMRCELALDALPEGAKELARLEVLLW